MDTDEPKQRRPLIIGTFEAEMALLFVQKKNYRYRLSDTNWKNLSSNKTEIYNSRGKSRVDRRCQIWEKKN